MKELFTENKEKELFVNRSQFRMDLKLAGDSFHILILKTYNRACSDINMYLWNRFPVNQSGEI